jgi:hypothetical protein
MGREAKQMNKKKIEGCEDCSEKQREKCRRIDDCEQGFSF